MVIIHEFLQNTNTGGKGVYCTSDFTKITINGGCKTIKGSGQVSKVFSDHVGLNGFIEALGAPKNGVDDPVQLSCGIGIVVAKKIRGLGLGFN